MRSNEAVNGLRSVVKRRLPFLVPVVRALRTARDQRPRWKNVKALAFQLGPHEGRFARIYERNHWSGSESLSGPGSSMDETGAVRRALPDLVSRLGVRRMVDIPCGDFHWMKELDLDLDAYIGVDIVGSLVGS